MERRAAVLAKEDPGNRLIGLLIPSQLAEQALGENGVAVFFTLALFHADHHTLWIDVIEFEVDQFAYPKPR